MNPLVGIAKLEQITSAVKISMKNVSCCHHLDIIIVV